MAITVVPLLSCMWVTLPSHTEKHSSRYASNYACIRMGNRTEGHLKKSLYKWTAQIESWMGHAAKVRNMGSL
ncbi:hypothetical protein BDP81DRAFT_435405 [Colletotrichum phormii]|uniref:Secreted protein n=1 Tax=Colletotrichum phormii TaxID=359342 RepID=A0AAI9ZLH7_9PEZI|nr:uncharacterized protein BDP81DRAFT_435405 [Colletotrichum phormii]KAK1625765.1 hypothetical protein BDP81DRAFT_435405 [Colletotrichum phormii]